MRFVLASKSPRRRELLAKIIPNFDIITRECSEELPVGLHPMEGVELLAVRKGRAVADILDDDALIISSDTLVELDGKPLGKPCDGDDAARMLTALSGQTHRVHTGVAVHYRGREYHGRATTAVTFRNLDPVEIEEYIRGGEPMDKAGAYGIQGEGGKFVLSTDGDFDTVVGLSLKLTKALVDMALGGNDCK